MPPFLQQGHVRMACLQRGGAAELGALFNLDARTAGLLRCSSGIGCSCWRPSHHPRSSLSEVRRETQRRPSVWRQAKSPGHLQQGQPAHRQQIQRRDLLECDGARALNRLTGIHRRLVGPAQVAMAPMSSRGPVPLSSKWPSVRATSGRFGW